jgi:hypothetical protein
MILKKKIKFKRKNIRKISTVKIKKLNIKKRKRQTENKRAKSFCKIKRDKMRHIIFPYLTENPSMVNIITDSS